MSSIVSINYRTMFVSTIRMGASALYHIVGIWLRKTAGFVRCTRYIWLSATLVQAVQSAARVPWVRELLFTAWISKLVKKPDNVVRGAVQRGLHKIETKVRAGHPHQGSAELRNGATEAMITAVKNMGLLPYVVSPSGREQEEGYRSYHRLADLAQEAFVDIIEDRHVIIMTDVDYYVNMDFYLSFRVPILLYTFQPERVAGRITDGAFTIKNDIVHSVISGGGTYDHKIWDYNHDAMWSSYVPRNFLVRMMSYALRMLGLIDASHVTLFYCDQFQLGQDRRIVALTPFAWLPGFVDVGEMGPRLGRMTYSVGDYNHLLYLDPVKGPVMSVGRSGLYSCATMPVAEFEAAHLSHAGSKNKTLGDTQRRSRLSDTEAPVLHDYLCGEIGESPKVVHAAGGLATHYTAIGKNNLDVPKTYARYYASGPLSVSAVFPTECKNNDDACVAGRIVKPQEEALQRIKNMPQNRFQRYATEFVEYLVPLVGKGRPVEIDDVVEKQNKPRQRERSAQVLWDTMFRAKDFVVRAFQKKEAYSSVTDPRNISSVPVGHTLGLSSYTYAFKEDVLKKCQWYVPGSTPGEIASRVQLFVTGRDAVVTTDYSRYDGTITQWLRDNVEHRAYRRWCAIENLSTLNTHLKAELYPVARTKHGVKYDPGCSRLSGSPLTTDGNTMLTAFSSYCANRECGSTPIKSWADIGCCYGDDGLSGGDVDCMIRDRTAAFLGLKLKSEKIGKNRPVEFLSRVFIDPWTTGSSFQAPLRTLLKLHCTVDGNQAIEACGVAKTEAYLVTDSKTPVISTWCRKYLALKDNITAAVTDDVSWWAKDEASKLSPWPQDEPGDREWDYIAQALDVTAAELKAYESELIAYSGDVMAMPSLSARSVPVKIEVLMDGEIHHPVPDKLTKSKSTKLNKPDNGHNLNITIRSAENGDVAKAERNLADRRGKGGPRENLRVCRPSGSGRDGRPPTKQGADNKGTKGRPGGNAVPDRQNSRGAADKPERRSGVGGKRTSVPPPNTRHRNPDGHHPVAARKD